ncbi:glycosyltransferase [Chryseolinea sp. H1M3-3]|uniref:glycosyltransferase n=1 Tax=Chryseolinea sp. H1M3-3 TaxID=3034144 RepID=UPI0023EB43E4|nr:glycosyltransferase [Chryseolinea sp. H1M3-3]
MTFVFILFFLMYFLFIGLLIAGWRKAISQKLPGPEEHHHLISIVIAARNEGSRIARLLADIQLQSYKNYEVIVVNDHSTDNTFEQAELFARMDARFTIIQNAGEGKKNALTKGIYYSKGDIIVTTDADCRVNNHWLTSISCYFQQSDTKMVFGGVRIEGDSFFSKIQAHEFLSLIGTSAATWAFGFPSMCNGANLAFRKTVFKEVGGYENNLHIPSGDDEFLMHKIFRAYPSGIKFVSNREAIVTTCPSSDLQQFLYQRIRWAGKWRHNLSITNVLLAIFIFFFHVSMMLLPVAAYLGFIQPVVAASLLIWKLVFEYTVLKKIADFLIVPWNWTAFIILQITYPLYAVGVGLISLFLSYEWKGRKLKSFSINTVKK